MSTHPHSVQEGRSPQLLGRLLACYQKALGHELPNQLVAIQGLARLLQLEEGERLSDEGRAHLQRLAVAAQRTHVLVRQLAELGRVGRGQERSASPAAFLAEIVREALAEVKQLCPTPSIEYHTGTPEFRLPVPAIDVRRLLVYWLRHLLREGNTGALVRVEINAQATSDRAVLRVSDNGGGFPPERLPHLFEPFAGHSGTEAGLDLFLVSLLVDSWGGTLEVQSELGRGSCLTVTMPPLRGEQDRGTNNCD